MSLEKQDAVWRRLYEGLSRGELRTVEEWAAELGCPEGAISSHLVYIRVNKGLGAFGTAMDGTRHIVAETEEMKARRMKFTASRSGRVKGKKKTIISDSSLYDNQERVNDNVKQTLRALEHAIAFRMSREPRYNPLPMLSGVLVEIMTS